MKVFVMRASGLVFAMGISISTSSCSDGTPGPSRESMPADTLKAGGIAYQEFTKWLSWKKGGVNELDVFVNSIDSYDVSIGRTDNSFFFSFKIRPFHGEPVKDNDDVYVVSKESWKAERVSR